jgi:hypothetical protein
VGKGRPRSVLTPAVTAVIEKTVNDSLHRPMSQTQLRDKLAQQGAPMSNSTLHRAKKELGIRGTMGTRKPERAFWPCNRKKRLAAVGLRRKWSKAHVRGIIWLDESEALRTSARVFQTPRGRDGKRVREMVPAADKKEEKVRFLVGAGNGEKFFFALPVRRVVRRDSDGRAIYPRGARRRNKGRKAGANAKANAPNRGETWTAARLIRISRPWIGKFKAARGLVIDNAGAHGKFAAYLRARGVNVIAHPPYSPDLNLAEDMIRDLKRDAEQSGLARDNC